MADSSRFHSILVGTDGSSTAATAVQHAGELAASSGARLTIVCAFDPTRSVIDPAEVHDADATWLSNPSNVAETIAARAASDAREAGLGDIETLAIAGDPADAIINAAEQVGADLIVVGNRGMTGARRFLLGSVPNKISHHAPCSVLIVRTA